MTGGRNRAGAAALAALLASGCASFGPRPASPRPRAIPPPAASLDARLLLVGDAGRPRLPRDPVLAALAAELAVRPDLTLAVFLGDNIYPRGLPSAGEPGAGRARARLDAQLEAIRSSGARALFLPGNHDWDRQGPDGLERIRNQGAYIAAYGGGRAEMVPAGGCPGPEIRPLGETALVVALDSQWWLHHHERPEGAGSPCPARSEAEALAALDRALAQAGGRHAVVVTHHPLASGGPHGGRFGLLDHLFPLRHLAGWAWLPLPGLGSLYPALRRSGLSDQDLSGPRNRRWRAAMQSVLGRRAPLLHAAGHEHGLQVLAGAGARHLLVSGGGSSGHCSRIAASDGARFARGASGYLRVEFLGDRSVWLTVVEVEETGSIEREPIRLD